MIKHEIASEILSNMGDECHAQSGYEILIQAMAENGCPTEDIKIIQEIQGDERNHALKLFNLAQKYNGVATSNDDMEETVKQITDGFAK